MKSRDTSTTSRSEMIETPPLPDLLELLAESDAHFDDAAALTGFSGYWDDVAPILQQQLLSYLNRAFQVLQVDLNKISEGSTIPPTKHLRKHDRVMERFMHILQQAGCVSEEGDHYVRSKTLLPLPSVAAALKDEIISDHPKFAVDTNMLAVTGPQLGECLSGQVNPLSLMFRDKAASQVLADFYGRSPAFSTQTEQLVTILGLLLNRLDEEAGPPLRILEVGAGLGGTTTRLLAFIQAMGVPVQYTVTDISPALVDAARERYSEHSEWMHFRAFDLEKEVPEDLQGQFDMVIGAMVVHATASRTQSCRRLYDLLAHGGFVILSEGTETIDWYDAAFGLLDGWWLGEDYPLQPPEIWMRDFKSAGFEQCGYSNADSPEAGMQRLLLACK